MDDPPPITLNPTDINWNEFINILNDYNDSTEDVLVNVIVLLISIIICIFGVVANGIVMYYLGFRIRRSTFTTYIFNLAIADFIFLLIFCSFVAFAIFFMDFKIGNYEGFDVLIALFMFGYATSQYFLTAISVERCLSILFPIWYQCRRSKKQSAIVCTVCWALSGVVFVAYFISCTHYERCTAISIFQAVLSFLILLPLMVVANVILVTLICRRSQRRHPPRLYILIITTVLAFLVLSAPLSLMMFLSAFDIDFEGYIITAIVSPIINSSFNPVIYFLVGNLRQRQRKCSIIGSLRRAFVEDTESTQQ